MTYSTFVLLMKDQEYDGDSGALCLKNRSSFEHQHHHLLHCLEKTTNHEFTDELTYSEMCMAESVGFRTSRSTSISSQQGVSTSCCPRRAKRRAIRLANSTVSVSRGSIQELDTLHVHKSPSGPQRYCLYHIITLSLTVTRLLHKTRPCSCIFSSHK
ncbi:potassium voltage-gated channel subfamily D member 1 [Tachysurus ichikawai]